MKTLGVIACLAALMSGSISVAQTTNTNLPTAEQAVKLVSRLHLGMREKAVTALLDRAGLKCNLIRMGDSLHWLNDCKLDKRHSLVVEFHNSPGQVGRWEDGVLQDAYITAWTGERVLSIVLTNAP